jgi:hypothetical protein
MATSTRKRTAKRTAEQSAPPPQAEPKSDGLPTGKAREQLARRIIQLREQGTKWDGEGGICDQVGIKTAVQGRKLIREVGAASLIAPSYSRDEAREQREAAASK